MPATPTIVWFRQDLRLADNPALRAALDRAGPVIPLYVHAPDEEGDWPAGGASRVYLHRSLTALDRGLRERGSRLIIRRGKSFDVLRDVIGSTGAGAVFYARRYEPAAVERDVEVEGGLKRDRIEARSVGGALLVEPGELMTQAGEPYKVFTPFWKAMQKLGEPEEPVAAPSQLPGPPSWPDSIDIAALGLLPDRDWDGPIFDYWTPGEAGAADRLARFVDSDLTRYDEVRNCPADDATSHLSPALHFGELSPRQVWHAVREKMRRTRKPQWEDNGWAFLREIAWREFSYQLLYHFPHTADRPLDSRFAEFKWSRSTRNLAAWRRGETGYPIVDAAMKQLWHIGWMHNRLRMIVASFLVKDLRIHWLEGAGWFWDTLVDADLSNNTMGWQWTAGCGADAAPYFRVFNPVTQGEKFDPGGTFVRRWLPALRDLDDRHIHSPWESGEPVDYPDPIVDHQQARKAALAAFDAIKS